MNTPLHEQLGEELYQALRQRQVLEPLSNRHPGLTIEDEPAMGVRAAATGRLVLTDARVASRRSAIPA